MAVSNVNDPIQDLFTAAETARAAQERANEEDRASKEGDPNAAPLETQFSQLLKERLTANMVFTRLDQQLNMPQRVISERQQSPIIDRRDDTPRDNDVDAFDPNGELDDPVRSAPVETNVAAQDYQRPIRQDTAPRTESASASRSDTQAASQSGKDGQAQAKDGATTSAAQSNNTAAAKAVQRTIATDALTGEEVTPELLEQAKSAAKSGAANLKATVTDESTRVASQPQSTLGAKAAVNAEATGRKGASAEALAQSEADSDAADEAEGSTNNIFNRVKAQASASGQATASTANAGGETADASKGGIAPGQANTANATQLNAGLQKAAAAGGQTSSLTGTSQSGVTVDSATGGTATLGQNNSIQQRSAAAPTTPASRPPPVPAQVLADQVAVNVQRGIAQGQDRITVQLRPQELGSINIKMEINQDGKTALVISAERPETLDMLRQDQRSLIDTLNEAGLQTDQNSLSFTQHGQDTGDGASTETANDNGTSSGSTDEGEDLIETGFNFEETGGTSGDGRLDVKI